MAKLSVGRGVNAPGMAGFRTGMPPSLAIYGKDMVDMPLNRKPFWWRLGARRTKWMG